MKVAPKARAARPASHSSDKSAPVKAIGGVVLTAVFGGAVVVVVVVTAGVVTGAADTGVLVVFVGHVVVVALAMSVVTGATGVPQLGPLQVAEFVMVPVASDGLAVTEKVSV